MTRQRPEDSLELVIVGDSTVFVNKFQVRLIVVESQTCHNFLKLPFLEVCKWNDFIFYAHDGVNAPTPDVDERESNQIRIFLAGVDKADCVAKGKAE